MSRWRTWLAVLGLVVATPLLSGCLTTTIARAVVNKVREHKSNADESRVEKRESK
jgi:hypothetical protein